MPPAVNITFSMLAIWASLGAGEVRAHLQGVGIGAAIEQRVVLRADDGVVAGAGADAVGTSAAVMYRTGRAGDGEAFGLIAQVERDRRR